MGYLMTYDEAERCNFQYVVLEIDEQKTILTRDNERRLGLSAYQLDRLLLRNQYNESATSFAYVRRIPEECSGGCRVAAA